MTYLIVFGVGVVVGLASVRIVSAYRRRRARLEFMKPITLREAVESFDLEKLKDRG